MAIINANRPGFGMHIRLIDDVASGVWVRANTLEYEIESLGEMRHYAQGKRRAVTWGARDVTVTVGLNYNTLAVHDTLRGWFDRVVVVRSMRGDVAAGFVSGFTSRADGVLAPGVYGGQLTVMASSDNGTLEGDRRR